MLRTGLLTDTAFNSESLYHRFSGRYDANERMVWPEKRSMTGKGRSLIVIKSLDRSSKGYHNMIKLCGMSNLVTEELHPYEIVGV